MRKLKKDYGLRSAILILFSIILGVIGLYHLTETSHAGGVGWASSVGSPQYRVDQVCRDGYTFSRREIILDDDGMDAQDYVNAISGDSVVAYGLYQGELENVAFSTFGLLEFFISIEEYDPTVWWPYYPIIGNALPIQEDDVGVVNNFEDEGIDVYLGQSRGYFFESFEVGDQIFFGRSGNTSVQFLLPVEDCELDSLKTDQAATFPYPRFSLPAGFFDIEDIYIDVLDLPGSGSLQLEGGTPLLTGDKISLVDLIAAENLVYTPTSDFENDQAFTYAVRGVTRVSVSENGNEGNGSSRNPSISADGQQIVFSSEATNLEDGVLDINGTSDVMQHSQFFDFTDYVLGSAADELDPAISPDGSEITFETVGEDLLNLGFGCFKAMDDNNAVDVYLLGASSAVSRRSMFYFDAAEPECNQIDQGGSNPAIADARLSNTAHLVFQTNSPIIAPDFADGNATTDIILNNGAFTELIYGVTEFGLVNPGLVHGGDQIAPVPTHTPTSTPLPFQNPPTATPTPTPQTVNAPNSVSTEPDISADGNVIAFESRATDLVKGFGGQLIDTNEDQDIYLSEWNPVDDSWIVERVSVTSGGAQAIGGDSSQPSVSQFGDHIAFSSFATNLDDRHAEGFAHVYVRDREAECTVLLSVNENGEAGNSLSGQPSISARGRYIAYTSLSSNLLGGDVVVGAQVYVVDRDADGDGSFYADQDSCTPGPIRVILASKDIDGVAGNDNSGNPDISNNGAFVAFDSDASNLVSDDSNGERDVFVAYLGYETELRFEAVLPEETPIPTSTETQPTATETPDPGTPSPTPDGTVDPTPELTSTPTSTIDPDDPGAIPPVAYLPFVFEE